MAPFLVWDNPRIGMGRPKNVCRRPKGSIPSGVFLGPDLPKRGFRPDSDPHGFKSGSEGIPWQLFSSRISWQPPNPAIMSKMNRNTEGFGSGFSDFLDLPQMENRGLGWIDLGLGSPKSLFLAQKPWFWNHFGLFPIIWGVPLGSLWGLFGLLPLGSSPFAE